MNRFCKLFVILPLVLSSSAAAASEPGLTDLCSRGYSVIPSPRTVKLGEGETAITTAWSYSTNVSRDHIAVRALVGDLQAFHSFQLAPARDREEDLILLSVQAGTVRTGTDPELDKQAYRLIIAPRRIDITGNSDQGLFYGVQTFLQLLKPDRPGRLVLPVATIEDWPAFQLRFLHWDTKHHQDRMETLKRYLDWSARFKVNMIGFELEDKFAYPSHPVIGAPGAFTPAELQEMVDYGLERFIQIVPQIQSPAHMAYVLKHPQYAHLRSDGNNYQSCMCDEKTYELLFSMYDDLLKATRGVQYFHVSTDEVYYAGICEKCSRPYNDENRSLTWIDFAKRAHAFLSARGRKMLAWVEYPVQAEHIRLLPPDLINGVMSSDDAQLREEAVLGMRQLIYASFQGEERLFPNHLSMETDRGVQPGRIAEAFETYRGMARLGNPMGVYGAAWDDSGLHGETFWLGWSAAAQYGWGPGRVSPDQHVADFMSVFYGPDVAGMTDVYRRLQSQARFFEKSWDRVVSRARGKAYGNSEGKGIGGTRYDMTLPPPALPSLPGLDYKPVYTGRYKDITDQARSMELQSDQLIEKLLERIPRVSCNRHNLEVFLSIAWLTRHHNRMLGALAGIEKTLLSAHSSAEGKQPRQALRQLVEAYRAAALVAQERTDVFKALSGVWEKSRFPKGQEVGGRKFYHVMDDTKDHWADRRPDLTYMIAPEESIGFDQWMTKLADVIQTFAQAHSLPVPELAS
ncbi:MAG: hypothetical protein EHM61_12215 [Acidobacteria bacterium]|nr:MAG: hypothetical protein EHM61_12215 [Acidobacteriota bacterium]